MCLSQLLLYVSNTGNYTYDLKVSILKKKSTTSLNLLRICGDGSDCSQCCNIFFCLHFPRVRVFIMTLIVFRNRLRFNLR